MLVQFSRLAGHNAPVPQLLSNITHAQLHTHVIHGLASVFSSISISLWVSIDNVRLRSLFDFSFQNFQTPDSILSKVLEGTLFEKHFLLPMQTLKTHIRPSTPDLANCLN